MGLFSTDSEVSIRVKKMAPSAILQLSPAEKADLACEIVQAKKKPGNSEKEAFIHLFAYLKEADYLTVSDRLAISRINQLIKADKELMQIAVNGGWSFADDQIRISILKRVISFHTKAFGMTEPTVVFRNFPNFSALGKFNPNSGIIEIDTHSDNGGANLSDLDTVLLTTLHEPTHRYQLTMARNRAYHTEVSSQARLFWANSKCYIEQVPWGKKANFNQPLERHARAVAEMGSLPVKQIREQEIENAFQEMQKVLKERIRQSNSTK